MEIYKRSLQSQIKWLLIGLIIALASTVGIYIYSQRMMNQSHIGDFVHGIQTGGIAGVVVVIISRVIKIMKTLKDESLAKKSYIESNDERNKFIFSKVASTSFPFEIYFLALGVIVSGFFNSVVSLTLLVVLAIKSILKLTLKEYYEKKF